MRISVFVPEQAVIEAISPAYRLFNAANQFLESAGNPPFFEVEYVGMSRDVKVQDGEYTVHTNRLLSEVSHTDLIVIPALYGDLDSAIEANRPAIPLLVKLFENGADIASLCLGAFLLAETGLLKGKQCSTHWAYCDAFSARFPDIQLVDGAIITDEGRIYSSGGANSIWNLLLYLLEKYTQRDLAVMAAKFFAIDIDRKDQNAFTIFNGQKNHADDDILSIQTHIEHHFAEKLQVDALAARIASTRRTFERRFKQATNNTVNTYIQRVRVEAAKRSFESGRKQINEVMYEVGYTDQKSFREVFKRITGLTPIAYRKKYAGLESMGEGVY